MKQLTIFDIPLNPFNIGEIVKVVNNADKDDPENYYYLKVFEGKEGRIREVIEKPRLQYRIEFRNGDGYFYHEELRSL